jgi:TctA family transporter
MLVGFVCVSFVTTGSLLNGMAMCLIGVLLGQIGTDIYSGTPRFTLDMPFLADGVGLVSIALGCFGIAEITKNLDSRNERTPFNVWIWLHHYEGPWQCGQCCLIPAESYDELHRDLGRK